MSTAEFLTPKQLADRWHLRDQTLANWRTARQGPPFIKIGSKVLYPVEGIHAYERLNQSWLQQQASPGTSAATPS
jgi:hypothetical protein